MKPQFTFMAVRTNEDGEEWLNTSTAYPVPDGAKMLADEADKSQPQWAQLHPVQRIAKVTLTETIY